MIRADGARVIRTGALIDLGLFAVALAAFLGLVFLFKGHVSLSLPVVLAGSAVQAVVLLLATTALLRWRGERWAQLGLARPPSMRRTAALVLGGYLGLALIAALLALLVLKPLGVGQADISLFDGMKGDALLYAGFLALAWLSAGLGEELLFRGFLWSRLERLIGGGRPAAVATLILQAVIFGLAHSYQQLAGILVTTAAGLVLGAVYLAGRRNLVACILLHGLIDTVSFTAVFAGFDPQA